MKKQYLFALGLVLVGVLTITAVDKTALANEGRDEQKREVRTTTENKVGFLINASGGAEIKGGKVSSVSGQNLMITIFGIPVTIAVPSSARVAGVAELARMNAGDTVSIKGKVDASTGIITASEVRNESQGEQEISRLRLQIQSLLEQLKKLQGLQ